MRYGDDHRVIGIKVFGIKISAERIDSGAAFVTVFVSYLFQFVFYDRAAYFVVAEDLVETLYKAHELVIFGTQFVHLQAGELAEPHLDYGACLGVIQIKALA